MLLAYEMAERDPEHRREWLTFVIIGGGPTGVELAGALAEISRQALSREFQHIDPSHARIILVEGVPRVLPPYPDDLSARRPGLSSSAWAWTSGPGRASPASTPPASRLGHERILARTVLWAAGVAASPLREEPRRAARSRRARARRARPWPSPARTTSS